MQGSARVAPFFSCAAACFRQTYSVRIISKPVARPDRLRPSPVFGTSVAGVAPAASAADLQGSFAWRLSEIDRNLLERCIQKKPRAWEDFVDRFMGLVLHVINHTAQARSVRL